ncbi:transmembrane protein, putative [Medicago truncatula]|uniref:Transmembrane protein, putative n=1 Tax=Medicago truncatula TaxID=3880 RepID=G7J3A8_MEDTR|nr:transmembrane protein, putative [Medicago truncatula]
MTACDSGVRNRRVSKDSTWETSLSLCHAHTASNFYLFLRSLALFFIIIDFNILTE